MAIVMMEAIQTHNMIFGDPGTDATDCDGRSGSSSGGTTEEDQVNAATQ